MTTLNLVLCGCSNFFFSQGGSSGDPKSRLGPGTGRISIITTLCSLYNISRLGGSGAGRSGSSIRGVHWPVDGGGSQPLSKNRRMFTRLIIFDGVYVYLGILDLPSFFGATCGAG